jgi:transcription initiation factor IIF auxiliary subunit
MKHRRLIFNIILLITFTLIFIFLIKDTFADDRASTRNEANNLASSIKSNVESAAKTNDFNNKVPGYSTDNPSETSLYNESESNIMAKASAKSSNSEESQLVHSSVAKRPEYKIKRNEDWLQKSDQVAADPRKEIDFLTGNYGDCEKTGGEPITSYHHKTCDEYSETSGHNCIVGREVEVKADHKYSCIKERKLYEQKCNKTLKVTCNSTHECNSTEFDSGGIVPGTVVADMAFNYNYPELTIGTIADNYWGGHCAVYDRNTSFNVKNIEAINEFKIVRAGFDDYIQITFNDRIVYVGPDGGTSLEVVERDVIVNDAYRDRRGNHHEAVTRKEKRINNGISDSGCERNTNWNNELNIDLKPYLKEGVNNLHIRVIVSGAGEGWVKIHAKQNCCTDFSDEWVDDCGSIPKWEG